jgi:light-regulated signal transduction histidine kinase (bacteriophytochrome)
VDLSALARLITGELAAKEPDRIVETIISDDVTATGDPALLKMAMENLFSNAWKFTSGHSRARIEFGFAENESRKEYFIRDDGAGFDMKYADRLFGAFQRLHSVAEFEGTGIGLALVQRIINRHRGTIRAEGSVEKGAAIYFTLSAV